MWWLVEQTVRAQLVMQQWKILLHCFLVHHIHLDVSDTVCPPVSAISSKALPPTLPPTFGDLGRCEKSFLFCSQLTFLSMTDTYVRTHVHCKNRSLIQSLALMRSAMISAGSVWYVGSFKLCYEILLLLNMADMECLLCGKLWSEQY